MSFNPDDDRWREYQVTPRYLAGSDGTGDAGFAPVAHWPHHDYDDGPCQLMVTSPDGRIRIGWFGDDYELWKIDASDEPLAPPSWIATFNHVTPAEIVAGLTTALAHDYDQGTDRFLDRPSLYWADAIQPLTDAGWSRDGAERGTVEFIAPDQQAGVLIDNRYTGRYDEHTTLWAGPPAYGTRAAAVFSTRTPTHLIAATAAAMTNPAPVIRERHHIHPRIEPFVTLTPHAPAPRAPTPLDVRRAAVTQAFQRATRRAQTISGQRVIAAHRRTSLPRPTAADTPGQIPRPSTPPERPSARHGR